MLIIISCLIAGIALGYFIKNKRFSRVNEKIYRLSVYTLLFFMGVSIGQNKEIFSNLTKIGLISTSIAVITIAGSIIFVLLIDKFILKLGKALK